MRTDTTHIESILKGAHENLERDLAGPNGDLLVASAPRLSLLPLRLQQQLLLRRQRCKGSRIRQHQLRRLRLGHVVGVGRCRAVNGGGAGTGVAVATGSSAGSVVRMLTFCQDPSGCRGFVSVALRPPG